MNWYTSANGRIRNGRLGLITGVLTLALGLAFGTATAQSDRLSPATNDSGSRVQGAISAVDWKDHTIVLEGRQFTIPRELKVDGVDLDREKVLQRLTVGSTITVIHKNDYSNTVSRIRTRLK